MNEPASAQPRRIHIALAVACVLFVAAIVVRGIPPAKTVAPQDVVEVGPRIAEPMQLLGRGARLRGAELDTWIAPERRDRFRTLRQQIFTLRTCPPMLDWLATLDGQRFERMVGELRTGRREEALASLALIYQLARATEWKPGIIASTPQAAAERLGGLLQDWLRTWGEKGAQDPLLAEPAVAAVLLYGHAMRTAQRAPVIGNLDEPLQRARAFLGETLATGQSRRSALGELVQGRHGAALARFMGNDDALRGFSADAITMFPDMTGDCP